MLNAIAETIPENQKRYIGSINFWKLILSFCFIVVNFIFSTMLLTPKTEGWISALLRDSVIR